MDNILDFQKISDDIKALKIEHDTLNQQLKGYHYCICSNLVSNMEITGKDIANLRNDFEHQGVKLEYNRNKLGRIIEKINNVINDYGPMKHYDVQKLEWFIKQLK
ncbi:Hypothetical_protein [Hexamita inflata]|uniref:Hypothetical_protein n=1 Tax=Hexamita inflata TaxID=28002 RepID=A0AA86NSK2_9EUKA|nr:Hypothetical protein HINF_LOCUS13362 [Hexamita inflata]